MAAASIFSILHHVPLLVDGAILFGGSGWWLALVHRLGRGLYSLTYRIHCTGISIREHCVWEGGRPHPVGRVSL